MLCLARHTCAGAIYFNYVALMNQVVMMGTQLYHDACVTQHHKYTAHQIALLYVSQGAAAYQEWRHGVLGCQITRAPVLLPAHKCLLLPLVLSSKASTCCKATRSQCDG